MVKKRPPTYNVLGGGFMIPFILIVFGFISSSVIFLFSNIDMNLKYLIIVVILDFFTDLLKAYLRKKMNRKKCIQKIFKKISYFVVIGVSFIIENILGMKNILRTLVTYSFLLTEILSILSNCTEMGIRLPKILISSLEVFRKKIADSEEKDVKKK